MPEISGLGLMHCMTMMVFESAHATWLLCCGQAAGFAGKVTCHASQVVKVFWSLCRNLKVLRCATRLDNTKLKTNDDGLLHTLVRSPRVLDQASGFSLYATQLTTEQHCFTSAYRYASQHIIFDTTTHSPALPLCRICLADFLITRSLRR